MKKIKFLFIALVIAISFSCISPVLYAEEETEKENTNIDEEEEKENILALIDEYLVEIDSKLNKIDKDIEDSKEQKEFDYYPAIRLNMDAPMFGLTAVVENKLRVKRDISTSDVAERYSIRDIVERNIIRLPESYLGAIVVSTKEYSIDDTMSIPQLKLTLVKCIQYLSQVNSVEEYIETQTNNIFRDYITDTKKANIRDVRDRVRKVTDDLENISDELKKLEFLGVDVTEYKETYNRLSDELYNINIASRNTLILDDELNNLIKESLNNESEVIDFSSEVTKTYENNLEEIDYLALLENIASRYENRIEKMDTYIENSTEISKVDEESEETVTTINYEVTSVATLDYMNTVLDDLNSQIEDSKKEEEQSNDESNQEENQSSDNVEENDIEKTDEQIEEERLQKVEENSAKIDELYNTYKEVIRREYNFYTSNINMLLKDSNDKISSIIAEIDSGIEIKNDIFNYTKYIYIDLPENLEKYIDENNIDSTIELESLIKLLRNELNDLSDNNTKITELYDDTLKEVLKS